jgi:lambda family phage portal protein
MSKPTFTRLDRVIAYFAPQTALERYRARNVLSASGAYVASRSDRSSMMLWGTSAGSGNRDLLPELDKIRRRSRDLVRNAPLAAGAINTVVTNVVGAGLLVKPTINRQVLGLSVEEANAWQRRALVIFNLWAESAECDLSRVMTFPAMQDLALRSCLENGDVLGAKRFIERPGSPFGLKIQLIEGDRLRNPGNVADTPVIMGGVEVDQVTGAPVAYHCMDRHPGDIGGRASTWTRLEAFGAKSGRRNVLHVYKMTRVGAVRGVPYLAPVVEAIKQISRYTEAEIMAAVLNACFAIVTKSDQGGGDIAATTTTDSAGQPINITEPGQFVDLGLNETVESFSPERPNTGFDTFVMAIMRQVGVALELPFEVLVKHFTASYSAARAAMLEAWKFFMARRKWFADSFCQPIYEDVLTEAIARGMLQAPGFFTDPVLMKAWCGAQWIGPSKGQLNEKDETDAAVMRVNAGLSSLEIETAALGNGDWESIIEQRIRENQLREQGGLNQSQVPLQNQPNPNTPAKQLDGPDQKDAA